MKRGFTLAEVLITLAIIGIVAALTIPAVVKNYKETRLKTQFKKSYSTLQQAFQKTQYDLGGIAACSYNKYSSDSIWSGCSEFFKKLADNLKVAKFCNNRALANGCVPKYAAYIEDASCGGFSQNCINTYNAAWVLGDGTIMITYYSINAPGALFLFDINGFQGPNKMGFDLFDFIILRDDNNNVAKIMPGGCSVRNNFVEPGAKTTTDMLKWVYK